MKMNMTLAARAERPARRLSLGLGALALAGSLVAIAGCIGTNSSIAQPATGMAPTTTSAAIGPDFAAINERAGPAVVQVRVTGVRDVSDRQGDENDDAAT